MNRNIIGLALSGLVTITCGAHAHITLPPEAALAGSAYTAAFRVGHACKDATATTGITVRLPAGFTLIDVPDRPGWKIDAQGSEVSWTAHTAADALPNHEKTHFVLRGQLPQAPGTLWFKVMQRCDQGRSADWAEIPDPGQRAKPAYPAARLEVVMPQPGLSPQAAASAAAASASASSKPTSTP